MKTKKIFLVIVKYPDGPSEIIGGWKTRELAEQQIAESHGVEKHFMDIHELDIEE
jgi:hypothetical protein